MNAIGLVTKGYIWQGEKIIRRVSPVNVQMQEREKKLSLKILEKKCINVKICRI